MNGNTLSENMAINSEGFLMISRGVKAMSVLGH